MYLLTLEQICVKLLTVRVCIVISIVSFFCRIIDKRVKMMKRIKLEGVKSLIRAVEAAVELVTLTHVYYLVWRNLYDATLFPTYFGNGKYLLSAVYVLLLLVIFQNFDGFRFGYLRLSEIIISQGIAVLIANIITYCQLSLIANKLITAIPMLTLTLIDAVVIFVFSYVCTWVYHRLYAPKNMVMIYGSENAV